MTDITTHQASRRRLLIALSLTCIFMVIQLVGAYFSNSLAVLADAGHLFVHNSSLFIALIASSLAIHLAKTYNAGYQKAELSGGLINGVLYLLISGVILYEGVMRYNHHALGHSHEVDSYLMSVIAAVGFLFHGASTWVLYKGRKDSINVYAVFLHSFFDLLSTVSTFIAGVLIHLTGLSVIDIISSMLISVFVLFTGVKVVFSCVQGLFFSEEKLPTVTEVERVINATEHVHNVHNVTVARREGALVVGAHIVLATNCTEQSHDEVCRVKVEQALTQQFGVATCVLQVEQAQCSHAVS